MQILSVNNNAKSPQGDSIYYPDVIYRQSQFVYWMDHNTGGTNWGTLLVQLVFLVEIILLDGTDVLRQIGSYIVFDRTDSGGSDENG